MVKIFQTSDDTLFDVFSTKIIKMACLKASILSRPPPCTLFFQNRHEQLTCPIHEQLTSDITPKRGII